MADTKISVPSITLKYFNGRGLMETPRLILAAVGKFAGTDYEDIRLSFEQFAAEQKSGILGHHNMNRVPLATINGTVIGQSKPISRVLASMHGLMGNSDVQAAQIDTICEHVYEMDDAYRKVRPYGATMTEEETKASLDKWFDTSLPAADRSERQLAWYLTNLELNVGSDGYAHGGRPSLADAVIYRSLADTVPSLGSKGEPYESKARTDGKLAGCPKVQKVISTFADNENVRKYLAQRAEMNIAF